MITVQQLVMYNDTCHKTFQNGQAVNCYQWVVEDNLSLVWSYWKYWEYDDIMKPCCLQLFYLGISL